MGWKRVKNCFRWLSLFLFHLFWSFAVLWPALKLSDLQLLLHLHLGAELWARFYAYTFYSERWGLGQRTVCWHLAVFMRSGPGHSCDSTVMHRVEFFSRVMLCCCTLQILAVSLKNSYLSLFSIFLQNYRNYPRNGCVVFYFLFFPLEVAYSHRVEE